MHTRGAVKRFRWTDGQTFRRRLQLLHFICSASRGKSVRYSAHAFEYRTYPDKVEYTGYLLDNY